MRVEEIDRRQLQVFCQPQTCALIHTCFGGKDYPTGGKGVQEVTIKRFQGISHV